MTIDKAKLKELALAVAELEDIPERQDEHAEAVAYLETHMHCHTILALLAEIDQLKAENEALRSAAMAAREFIMHEAEVRGLLDENGQVPHRHPRRQSAIAKIDAAMAKEASHD